MGTPINPNSLDAFLSLPPGCLFRPSDEQLICHYLASKNNGSRTDVIKEMDLYNFNPFDLPETSCFRFGRGGRRRHWYCFVARRKERGRRRAGGGYWRKWGKVRDVVGGGAGKAVVGMRTSFVFYLGDSPGTAVRTKWVMYEYALIDHTKDAFVLCRVSLKSHHSSDVLAYRTNSCREVRLPLVPEASLLYNRVSPDGCKVNGDSFVHHENEVSNLPMRSANKLEACLVGKRSSEETTLTGQTASESIEGLENRHMVAILEEDFIELDDLLCPLSGID